MRNKEKGDSEKNNEKQCKCDRAFDDRPCKSIITGDNYRYRSSKDF